MKMTVSDSTLALLASAEGTTNLAARLGVSAVVALIEENITVVFKHGDAVQLATLLVNGGISKHTAKRYADISVMAVKAIQHQMTLAASKAKPADKPAVKAASQMASLASLAGVSDMRKIREWAKENGPKADKVEKKADKVDAPAQAETLFPPETPAQAEKTGQLREIKETLVMLNSGQLTPDEALETIALIVGSMIIKPAAPTKTPRRKTGT